MYEVFTATGFLRTAVSTTASTVALPTNGSSSPAAIKLLVSNTTNTDVFVVLGGSGVTVSTSTGSVVLPGKTRAFFIGAATYAALVFDTGGSQYVVLETGY